MRLLILGARVFAEEVADLASDIPGLEVAGFVENLDRDHPRELRGRPVYWIDDAAAMAATHHVVCALTTTRRRPLVDRAEAFGFPFATLVHPTARVPASTVVGAGSIVSAGCYLGAHGTIGRHVILNRGTLVGHHTEIGDFVTVQPGGNIAGLCRIGAGAYLSIGTTVVDRLVIGDGTVIGPGAVVTKHLPERVFAAGAPARVARRQVPPR